MHVVDHTGRVDVFWIDFAKVWLVASRPRLFLEELATKGGRPSFETAKMVHVCASMSASLSPNDAGVFYVRSTLQCVQGSQHCFLLTANWWEGQRLVEQHSACAMLLGLAAEL